jgi:hypothetical protein
MRELNLYVDCQSQMMETARSPRDASNYFLDSISYTPRRFESYNNDNFVYLFNNIFVVQTVFSYKNLNKFNSPVFPNWKL